MARKKSKFRVQEAIKRPGRVRSYIKRLYGDRAFTKQGTIKQEYLMRAIERVKNSRMPKEKKKSLLSALNLARNLKSWAKKR